MKNKKNNKKYYLFQMKLSILNIVSFFLLFLMLLITYIINKEFLISSFYEVFSSFIVLILLMFGFMILHEILHSVAYCIYGGKFNKIVYGIQLEKGVFYCLCKQNITKINVLNSLLFPFFYIGVVTYILSLIFYEPYLLWLSIFNISGCCGDIIMFIFISRLNKNIEFSELDDSTSFALYSDDDVSKYNHFGLKYIGCCDKIERNDLKKVKISKFSYVILFIFIIVIILFNVCK